VLAAAGCARPAVYRRPRVAVLATGDELVDPGAKPSPWQIRNSNAYQVCAQAQRMGCAAANHGIARDNDASLDEHLARALPECDVLVISGGVSMGEFDLVPGALRRHGFAIRFDRVAIQPGKPTTFAESDKQWCFGLPGNPVSTFVIFEVLARPFLFALMGHAYRAPRVRLTLAQTMTRKSGARQSWVPVSTTGDGRIGRVDYLGSSHINALSHADGLIAFPQGVTELVEGSVLDVRLIRD
jgi:molybdopterin molybdotransferase